MGASSLGASTWGTSIGGAAAGDASTRESSTEGLSRVKTLPLTLIKFMQCLIDNPLDEGVSIGQDNIDVGSKISKEINFNKHPGI